MAERDLGEMAFEEQVADEPTELWRVVCYRFWNEREIRTINWFATEAAARNHVDRINDGRGRVESMIKYERSASNDL